MSDRPTFAPYLVVSNAAAAIDFYKNAFGAEELVRHLAPGTDKLYARSSGGPWRPSDAVRRLL